MDASWKVVWANSPLQTEDASQLFFFPAFGGHDRALSPDLVEKLQFVPAAFYGTASATLGKAIAAEFSIPLAAATTVVRDAVAVIGYAIIDRLLRFHLLLKTHKPSSLEVARAPSDFVIPSSLLGLAAAIAASQPLNQFLLERIAPLWGIALALPPSPGTRASSKIAAVKNYNFRPLTLLDRARSRALRWLSLRFGRIPAAHMAYDEPELVQAGLFGPNRLAYLRGRIDTARVEKNEQLRLRLLLQLVASCDKEWRSLWSRLGVDDQFVCDHGLPVFGRLLLDIFPAERLEAIPTQYPAAVAELHRFAGRAILFSAMLDVYSVYLLAAAKSLNMKVIGSQHAAHYGIIDAPCYHELELRHCDAFVTWGYSRYPVENGQPMPPPVPLPTPCLSERRKMWIAHTGRPDFLQRELSYDVLLVTDRLQDFPPSITTLRMSRPDFMAKVTDWLAEVVSSLTSSGLRVLHKPFNEKSLELLGDLPNRLAAKAEGRYTVYDRLDKGLAPELVRQCAVLVWDEPGSGFFECLAAGIPAMLYWPRMIYREAEHVRPVFDRLAAAGIAHENAASLRDALLAFNADGAAWMRDRNRQATIAKACRALAWCENDWKSAWLKFIRTL